MKAALFLVAACLLASTAAAGTITITIAQEAELRDGEFAVDVKVSNSGDEAAHSVTPILRFGDEEVRGKTHPALAPNRALEASLAVPVSDLGEGRWPYQIAVDYTDANQYPFQALQVATYIVGNPPPAKVAVPEIDAPAISGTGELAIRIRNLTGSERRAKVGVLAPEGLEVTEPAGEIVLAAWGEKTISVPVTNRTALPGSRYPVFVAVEYDDGPVHHTLVARGMVEIVGTGSFLDSGGPYLWIGAALLGFVFVLLVVFRVARR